MKQQERKRTPRAELPEDLERARGEDMHELFFVGADRVEPPRHVHQRWKEADDRCDDHLRQNPNAKDQDDDRRDGENRNRVEEEHDGK